MTREEILGYVEAALRRCHGDAAAARVMRELEDRVSTTPEEICGEHPAVGLGPGDSINANWIFRRDARLRSSRIYLGEIEIPGVQQIIVEDSVDSYPTITLRICAPHLQTIRGAGPAAATTNEADL